jgi:GT2 family glycosyltransferase
MSPRASVVVPTFQERGHIRDCLTSLLAQDEADFEVLVVDGRSTDGTRDILESIAEHDPRVVLVDNPERSAGAALNRGLEVARGAYLVRADAHALYAPDYVRRSIEVLDETGADDVGGPMRPVGTNRFGRAVAAVTSSKIGMGSGAFHWTREAVETDTVFLGCYRTDLLRTLGGWDSEALQWGAEDHELNFRVTRGGGRIVCDPAIESWYFPRETPRALWRQYRNYGTGKVSTLAKHRRLPTPRPLAPAALVAALAAGTVLTATTGKVRYLVPGAVWAASIAAAAKRFGREPGVDTRSALAVLAICHVGYGVGFWSGTMRRLTGREFDRLPGGSR